jgi:hypothetical protein
MLGPRFCCAEISGLYSVFPSPSLFGVDQEGPSPCPPVHVQPGVAVPRNLADLQRRLLIALLCSALHSTEEASLGTGLLRGLFFSEEKGAILLLYYLGRGLVQERSFWKSSLALITGKRAARPWM